MNTQKMNRSVRCLLTTWVLLTLILTLAGPGASVAHAAGYVVTNLNDSGAGSLRQAILNANAAAGEDTITFRVKGTILLSSSLPDITDTAGLIIDGPGRKSLTLNGDYVGQLMWVNRGAALALHNLTVANFQSFINGGAILNLGTLDVSNSTFWGNTGDEGFGGGILSYGTLDVTDSIFSGNRAGVGGGISSFGTMTVTNSTFSGNQGSHPDGGGGGGIANYGTLSVSNSAFSGNFADIDGGGIYNAGTLDVSNSTFSGNKLSGGGGGGIFNRGTVTVTNSTFSDNRAQVGGGIHNSGTLSVANSTFSGNRAKDGGGILNDGTLTLNNTIVANRTGVNCTNNGSLVDGGGNLSWPDTTCPGLNVEPLLGPLQNNGGPTQTHALLAGSPAVDAALLANCPAADQRGVSRPQGAGCDIGAYELE